MQFAFFTHLPWPENTDPTQIIQEATLQVQYAETLGFKSAWLAEHHFTRYSMGSSSLILATHLASSTRTIRLGTAVLVSPLHNPIRLAEDTATLDLISGGRIDVGFGRGSSGYEYHGFNINADDSQERFQDSVRVIRGLWTTPEFSYNSRHYQVNQGNLVPMPVQDPHPPIYIAATRTAATLDFAISEGHQLCIAVVQDTSDALDLCKRYVNQSKESGRTVSIGDIPFFRYIYVAETEEQAYNDTHDHLNWVIDIMQWRRNIDTGSEVHRKIVDWRTTRTELPASYDYLATNRAIIGTPEQCLEKIRALRQEGIQYFGCNFDFGGISHPKVMKSMKLFSEKVMPELN